jgi:hypothetical protein
MSPLPCGPPTGRAQGGADHLQALADQLADVQFALDAALHADDHQPAVGRQRIEIAVQVGRAHDVEDHVGASRRSLVDMLDEVVVAVVDRECRRRVRGTNPALPSDPAVTATTAPSCLAT